MRIIAGKYKSRRIYTPPAMENCTKGQLSGFRPTTDRARESLFNVLNNIIDFDDTVCLDLFAGSGALGFEALSRGAALCNFVETSRKQIEMMKKTAEELGCTENIEIHAEEVIKFLKLNTGAFYDLVFADPPYQFEDYNELVSEVMNLKFSVFALEHGAVCDVMYNAGEYDVVEKKIGAVSFKIFVNKNN